MLGNLLAHEVGEAVLPGLFHGPGRLLPGGFGFAAVPEEPGFGGGQPEDGVLLHQGVGPGQGEDGGDVRSDEKAGVVPGSDEGAALAEGVKLSGTVGKEDAEGVAPTEATAKLPEGLQGVAAVQSV